MAPAHVGLLTTGKVQKEDIAAQIIHLAVGGHLRVTPIEQPAGRWGRKGGRAWRLDRTTADPSSLEPTRRALLEALFCDGPSVTLGDASTRVTGSVEALRERLVEEARTAGWVDKNPARGATPCWPLRHGSPSRSRAS